MKLVKSGLLGFLLFTVLSGVAGAAELGAGLRAQLDKLDIPLENVRPTPVNGLYEVQLGNRIYYLSDDGNYLLVGNMIDLQTKQNLTEDRLGGIRVDALDSVKSNQLISFKSSKPKHTVTVFTDIDCGYCRKLHSEIEQYNQAGITVNYLFYPRTGLGTASYQKAVSVWCSKDRQKALTRAKAGEALPKKDCTNPVTSHFELGQAMEISGTPAIVTETGSLIPGYVPPSMLRKQLDEGKM